MSTNYRIQVHVEMTPSPEPVSETLTQTDVGTFERNRQASTLVNRVRHQPGATPSRILRENVESEGREVMSFLEQQAQSILEEAGFTPEGIPTEAATGNSCNSVQYDSSQTLLSLPAEQVEQVIRACAPEPDWQAEMQRNPVAYEDPTNSRAPSP